MTNPSHHQLHILPSFGALQALPCCSSSTPTELLIAEVGLAVATGIACLGKS